MIFLLAVVLWLNCSHAANAVFVTSSGFIVLLPGEHLLHLEQCSGSSGSGSGLYELQLFHLYRCTINTISVINFNCHLFECCGCSYQLLLMVLKELMLDDAPLP